MKTPGVSVELHGPRRDAAAKSSQERFNGDF